MVRQLIAHGVTYPAFSRLVKEVYIEVGRGTSRSTSRSRPTAAWRWSPASRARRSGSCAAARCRPPSALIAAAPRLPARLVSRWLAGPPYTNAAGAPFRLPYESERSAQLRRAGRRARRRHSAARRARRAVARRRGDADAAWQRPPRRAGLCAGRRRGGAAGAARSRRGRSHRRRRCTISSITADDAFVQRSVRYDHLGAEALPAVRARLRALGADFPADRESVLQRRRSRPHARRPADAATAPSSACTTSTPRSTTDHGRERRAPRRTPTRDTRTPRAAGQRGARRASCVVDVCWLPRYSPTRRCSTSTFCSSTA